MLYVVLTGHLEGWGLDSPQGSSLIYLMVDAGFWLDLSWAWGCDTSTWPPCLPGLPRDMVFEF